MSNFFQNLPHKLANFMVGRNGPDALARASLWMGVLFTFLEIVTGLGICSLIGMVFLLYFMFRCFSRNIAARTRENARYIARRLGSFQHAVGSAQDDQVPEVPAVRPIAYRAQGQRHAEGHLPQVPQPVHDEVVESQSSG